jgi:hypothetical protein
VASATNTGKLSSTDWSTFNNKIAGSGTINNIPKFTASGTIGDSSLSDDSGTLRYQGIGFRGLDIKSTNNSTSIRLESYSASTNADNGIKEIEMDGYYSSFNSYFGYNSSGAEWLINGYADTVANTTNRGTTTWQIPSLDGTYGYFDVRSYHSATPIIRAFASNNVVIGGSTNNSFKLEVVGTTKISGVLTLGSTISNGTNTYTLPSATGTLALTSDLSSYVPYTGAIADVDLGVNFLKARTFYAEGNGGGGSYAIKNGTTPSFEDGYTILSSNDYRLNILSTVSTVTKAVYLGFSGVTATRTYTLPDLSGTLALLEGTQTFSGNKTFSALTAFTFANGTRMDYGLYLSKGAVPSAFTSLTTNIYSDATTNNIVIRDNSSVAKLDFNNSTQTYTFPASSGTIALTSDLSGYVPYTGATSNVNLGVYDISVSGIKVESNVSGGTAVNIKQNSTTLIAGAGYISIGAKDLDTLLFSYGGATNSDYKAIRLKTTNIPNTSSRVYEFPNADGTLALTSNLSAYLPLTGGTLTGALSGTSATFSSNLSAAQATFTSATNPLIIKGTNASTQWTEYYYNTSTLLGYIGNGSGILTGGLSSDFIFRSETNFVIATGGNNRRMTITGAGNVGIGTSSPTAFSGNTVLAINNAAGGAVLELQSNGTSAFRMATSSSDSALWEPRSVPVLFATANSERMRITIDGNVGIGTSSPSGAAGLALVLNSGASQGRICIKTSATGDASGAGLQIGMAGVDAFIEQRENAALSFATNAAERMRITSGGNVCIGSTSAISTRQELRIGGNAGGSRISLGISGTNYSALVTDSGGNVYISNEYNDANIKLLMINYSNGVYLSQSATSWTANSDERLKNINGTIENAVDKLKTLRAVNFSWKSDENKKEVLGLIAQDVEKVFPQVIDKNKLVNQKTEIKDETEYLGVRYVELVPVLIAAIQEQQAQIEELKQLIKNK